jgi:hypothetical protein
MPPSNGISQKKPHLPEKTRRMVAENPIKKAAMLNLALPQGALSATKL